MNELNISDEMILDDLILNHSDSIKFDQEFDMNGKIIIIIGLLEESYLIFRYNDKSFIKDIDLDVIVELDEYFKR